MKRIFRPIRRNSGNIQNLRIIIFSHSCYHRVEDDKLLCSKCKRILTNFTETANHCDSYSDQSDSNSDSESDFDDLGSSLYSSGSVVSSFISVHSSLTTVRI